MTIPQNLAVLGLMALLLLIAWLRIKAHLRAACDQHWLAGYARGRQAERREHESDL